MNYEVKTIAEHSFVPSLLPSKANVIDGGCRGFQFTNELRKLGHNVYAIDIDELNGIYFRCAISDVNGKLNIKRNSDPQATRVSKSSEGLLLEGEIVDCFKIETIMAGLSISMCDLIKLDIEGSEYEVIMSLEKPPAKQLSIEFHLHTHVYGQHEMTMMEDKLKSLGYEFVKHDYTTQHGAGCNYWDSLFVLK